MKFKGLMMLLCASALLAGCGTPDECTWTKTLPLRDQHVVGWLINNDRDLLEGIVAHNEKRAEFCG